MKLRIANKIMANCANDDDRYTRGQLTMALRRYEKTQLARDTNEFWYWTMRQIGPEGRAELCSRWGMAGSAFRILMEETP